MLAMGKDSAMDIGILYNLGSLIRIQSILTASNYVDINRGDRLHFFLLFCRPDRKWSRITALVTALQTVIWFNEGSTQISLLKCQSRIPTDANNLNLIQHLPGYTENKCPKPNTSPHSSVFNCFIRVSSRCLACHKPETPPKTCWIRGLSVANRYQS